MEKLGINSMYGKTGEKEIECDFALVNPDDMLKLEVKKDIIQEHKFGNRTLVKTTEYNHELKELINLMVNTELMGEDSSPRVFDSGMGEVDYKNILAKGEKISLRVPARKKGGVKSSVSIAAAVTAYARISINTFKNIPGNKYFGGDTDSVIMEHPLDP
jgi:hypothetical protein